MNTIERQKSMKFIVTFPTTSAAMSMEAACGEGKGRLIPIPQAISAGCGLAWCAPPELEQELLALMEQNGIAYEEKRILPLY